MSIVSTDVVIDALRRAGTTIPDPFYLGTIKHESGFDAALPTYESNGTVSLGLYQVNASEAQEAGESPAELLDVDVNTRVYVYLAERNRAAIRAQVGLTSADADPWDMGAYLTVAHNQGLQAALDTISEWGMDWAAYIDRNGDVVRPGFNGPRIVKYGNDCLYDPVTGASAAPRSAPSLVLGVAGVGFAIGLALLVG